jgi:dolichol kinase
MALTHTAARLEGLRQMKLSVLGRERSLPHFERKFYHALMGLMCFSLYSFVLTREQALLTLAVVGGAFVSLDVMRLRLPKMNDLTLKLFGKIMRREELKSVTGNSFYILGLFLIVLAFPAPVVMLSVLYLALGDPTAAMVGSLYGRHKLIGKKSWEGALANFAISSFATLVVALLLFHFSAPKALALALVGGVVSVLAELCPLPVDDNLSIPVLSALMLFPILSVFF